jgi:hypothetical protein
MSVKMSWIAVCGCVCACYSLGPVAHAGPAEDKAFARQFGAKVAEVKRTQTYVDDIALAQEMIKVANAPQSKVDMIRVLCNRSFSLAATTPRGYSVAIRAMMLLEKKDRASRIQTLRKVVPIQMRMFRNATSKRKPPMGKVLITNHLAIAKADEKQGDLASAMTHLAGAVSVARTIKSPRLEALDKQARMLATQRLTQNKIRQLKAALKLNPKNSAAAMQLVRAYVVEMDRPEAARLYTFLLPEGDLRKNVGLINKPVGQLALEDVGTLAHWYHDLGTTRTDGYRFAMLRRAKGYYQLVMDRDRGPGRKRKLAGLAHAEITAALAEAR